MSHRPVRDVATGLLIALGVASPFGCTQKPTETLYPVEGRVSLTGQPLTQGSVSFRPDPAGGKWHQPTGVINTAGKYELFTDGKRGAPPGRYRVVVFSSKPAPATGAAPGLPVSEIPVRYNQPDQSPLVITVVAAPPEGAYDLELKHE